MDGIRNQEYELLMETARKHLDPSWKYGEVTVLKTAKGNLYAVRIPDYQDAATREPLENLCIRQLAEAEDTEVCSCLATVNGNTPEILSWNFRSGLVTLNPSNLNTMQFLWGGEDHIHMKPFSALLPPKKA